MLQDKAETSDGASQTIAGDNVEPSRLTDYAPSVVSPSWLETSDLQDLRIETKTMPVIGVTELDDDHFRLAVHYNALIRGLSRHRDAATFALSFHSLIHRVRRHFESEERLMAETDFDGYSAHKLVHKKLISDAQRFLVSLIGRTERDQCVTVAKWFRHWLINHIKIQDRKIGEFLSSNIWQS